MIDQDATAAPVILQKLSNETISNMLAETGSSDCLYFVLSKSNVDTFIVGTPGQREVWKWLMKYVSLDLILNQSRPVAPAA